VTITAIVFLVDQHILPSTLRNIKVVTVVTLGHRERPVVAAQRGPRMSASLAHDRQQRVACCLLGLPTADTDTPSKGQLTGQANVPQ
jgi:hypothetical protein